MQFLSLDIQDAKKILGETAEGKGVIASIEKAGFMTKSVRLRMVKILVSHLIFYHGTK